jgi:hypothetical protein
MKFKTKSAIVSIYLLSVIFMFSGCGGTPKNRIWYGNNGMTILRFAFKKQYFTYSLQR